MVYAHLAACYNMVKAKHNHTLLLSIARLWIWTLGSLRVCMWFMGQECNWGIGLQGLQAARSCDTFHTDQAMAPLNNTGCKDMPASPKHSGAFVPQLLELHTDGRPCASGGCAFQNRDQWLLAKGRPSCKVCFFSMFFLDHCAFHFWGFIGSTLAKIIPQLDKELAKYL